MTWTYTGFTDPLFAQIDEVRLLIGDTNSSDQQLQDEEIQYYIDTYGPGINAAIPAVQGIMAKCARLVDEKTGEVEVDWSDKLNNYGKLLDQLQEQKLTKNVPDVFAGGTSVTDIENRESDTDRVQDCFTVGMDDNHEYKP